MNRQVEQAGEAEQGGSAANTGATSSSIDRALRFLPLFFVSHFLLAAPALLLSIAVAYYTFVQADATKKMQVASVWPHVGYETSNRSADGAQIINLSLVNKGVGPAHVEAMEISYQGQAYTEFRALLGACCADDPAALMIGMGSVIGEVLRPGEDLMFAQLDAAKVPADVWQRFDAERVKVKIRLCYCSVFGDCWVGGGSGSEARAVASCPADWSLYRAAPGLVSTD